MKMNFPFIRTLASIAIVSAFLFEGSATANPFPPAGNDFPISLGGFQIAFANTTYGNAMQSALCPAGSTHCSSSGGVTSYLSDLLWEYAPYTGTATTVYHGTPYFSGGGLLVDPNTVDTRIVSMNMTTVPWVTPDIPGVAVKAGDALRDPLSPSTPTPSPGQVTSLDMHTGGFPASSYFDVTTHIDLSGVPGLPAGSILYNPTLPLHITNPNLTSFPPDVVYIHQMPDAVPVYLNMGGSASYKVGYLTVAGHGVFPFPGSLTGLDVSTLTTFTQADFEAACPGCLGKFNTAMAGAPVAPITGVSLSAPDTLATVPVPATLWLFGVGLAGLLGHSRRKAA